MKCRREIAVHLPRCSLESMLSGPGAVVLGDCESLRLVDSAPYWIRSGRKGPPKTLGNGRNGAHEGTRDSELHCATAAAYIIRAGSRPDMPSNQRIVSHSTNSFGLLLISRQQIYSINVGRFPLLANTRAALPVKIEEQ
jgi:hypothetical protein